MTKRTLNGQNEHPMTPNERYLGKTNIPVTNKRYMDKRTSHDQTNITWAKQTSHDQTKVTWTKRTSHDPKRTLLGQNEHSITNERYKTNILLTNKRYMQRTSHGQTNFTWTNEHPMTKRALQRQYEHSMIKITLHRQCEHPMTKRTLHRQCENPMAKRTLRGQNVRCIKETCPGLKSSKNRRFYFGFFIWPYPARLQLRFRWGHLVTGDWTGSEIQSLNIFCDSMKLLAELPACPVAINTNTISIACERGPYDVNMSIAFNFGAAHSPARLDMEMKFLISNYWQPCKKIRNTRISSPHVYLA